MRATYGERASAARRARDANPRTAEPCQCCGMLVRQHLRCGACQAEYKRIGLELGVDAAEIWARSLESSATKGAR